MLAPLKIIIKKMNNLKNKILLLCPKCERMMLVERSEYDLYNAIFMEVYCEKCGGEGDKEDCPSYYDKKGYMNDRYGLVIAYE